VQTLERAKRHSKKLIISISGDTNSEINLLGLTSDISVAGMCISTDKKLPLNEKVTVLVAAEGDIYSLNGESIWSKTYSDSLVSTGISLVSASMDYVHFVNKINYH